MPSHPPLPMRRVEPGTEEKQDIAEEVVATHGAEQEATTPPTRRQFLTRTAGTALALLLAGLPRGWVGEVYASDAPETSQVRIGIIALTDCSSIVMAYELGLFKKYGRHAPARWHCARFCTRTESIAVG